MMMTISLSVRIHSIMLAPLEAMYNHSLGRSFINCGFKSERVQLTFFLLSFYFLPAIWAKTYNMWNDGSDGEEGREYELEDVKGSFEFISAAGEISYNIWIADAEPEDLGREETAKVIE